MPSDMQPLGNFVTLVSGSTPSKANPDFWGGTTPWISAKDMGDFWIEDAEDHLTEAGVAAASRLVQEGTVLLLARGMTLHKRVPICRVTRPSTFNQDVKAVLPKKGLSSRFLPYLLVGNHDRLHERVDSAGHGTGRLNSDALLGFPVRVPSPVEQEGIADIGEALDERIRLLRQTNVTLESIVSSIFKSWFVDFEPVRAKIEGREPSGMEPTVAALFPCALKKGNSGYIPSGWHEASIYEIAQVVYGAPFASSRFNSEGNGRPLIRIRDLRDEAPGVHTDEVHPKGYLVQPGDIVVGMDGEFRAYLWGGDEAWLNQRVCVFQPRHGVPAAFLRSTVEPQLAHVEATETATTVIHLGKGDIDGFVSLLPSPDVLTAFAQIANPVYERVVANKQTIRSLEGLRDTLIPRLVSGLLRLPECQEELREMIA